MTDTQFGCLPTIIGSMPHKDAKAATALVARYLKDVPAWCQLPERTFRENMYAQYSEGFPGVAIENERVYIKRADFNKGLEQLYTDYLANDFRNYGISPENAAGLHAFLALDNIAPRAVKGQIAGPFSWGLGVTDEDRRAILYDDTMADAVARFLRLKAAWQENELARLSKNTIIFLDEPYMTSFGSAFVSVSRDKVIGLLDEVFSGIRGYKGVHCCGNTDWSVLLATQAQILSFDAYNFAQSLGLFPSEVKSFIARQGAIAWGIVPNEAEALAKESVASLKDRLEEAIAPFTRDGIPFRQLVEQGLLTPSCGLARLTEAAAEQVLSLLAGLSDAIRQRYL